MSRAEPDPNTIDDGFIHPWTFKNKGEVSKAEDAVDAFFKHQKEQAANKWEGSADDALDWLESAGRARTWIPLNIR